MLLKSTWRKEQTQDTFRERACSKGDKIHSEKGADTREVQGVWLAEAEGANFVKQVINIRDMDHLCMNLTE